MKEIILLLILSSLFLNSGLAEETKKSSLEAIEFFYGNARGDLRKMDDYELYSFMVDFDFDLNTSLQNWNLSLQNLVQLQIEPFASYVYSPGKETEFGTSCLLKIGLLPENWTLQPYIKGGIGIIYMSLETLEQGTQFNFTEHLGVGAHFFLTDNLALTFEYRFRHLSNADIKEPNAGLNTDAILGGIAYRF